MKASGLRIEIPRGCYRVYTAAAQRLRDKLGANAPDAEALIQFELANRDPQMIADEFLETGVRRNDRSRERKGRRDRLKTSSGQPAAAHILPARRLLMPRDPGAN